MLSKLRDWVHNLMKAIFFTLTGEVFSLHSVHGFNFALFFGALHSVHIWLNVASVNAIFA